MNQLKLDAPRRNRAVGFVAIALSFTLFGCGAEQAPEFAQVTRDDIEQQNSISAHPLRLPSVLPEGVELGRDYEGDSPFALISTYRSGKGSSERWDSRYEGSAAGDVVKVVQHSLNSHQGLCGPWKNGQEWTLLRDEIEEFVVTLCAPADSEVPDAALEYWKSVEFTPALDDVAWLAS